MAEDFLSSLAVEEESEALPQLVGGGRTAVEPPPAIVTAVKSSYDLFKAGKGAEAVRRVFVPVKPLEIDWRETKRKDKNGKEIVTRFQQHPNVAQIITVLRKAAEKQGIGVRIVVDYHRTDDGNKLKIQGPKSEHPNTVRVRFLGMDRKKTKKTKNVEAQAQATPNAA